jgi:hypothetical protein
MSSNITYLAMCNDRGWSDDESEWTDYFCIEIPYSETDSKGVGHYLGAYEIAVEIEGVKKIGKVAYDLLAKYDKPNISLFDDFKCCENTNDLLQFSRSISRARANRVINRHGLYIYCYLFISKYILDLLGEERANNIKTKVQELSKKNFKIHKVMEPFISHTVSFEDFIGLSNLRTIKSPYNLRPRKV